MISTRAAIAILIVACALFWGNVLFAGRVLLPGAMLRGFAPFGGDAQAPWTILKWDALAQYFPWRFFAASELHRGHIPLWNPHQFSGAPFVANGQSAVFYIGSVFFWAGDVARAFGIAAFAHSLLASLGAFALLRHWKLSVGSSIFGALSWAFCGYLSEWSALPTLANTASWLPLLVWLFERAVSSREPQVLAGESTSSAPASRALQVLEAPSARLPLFALALCSALLAGHAQVFAFVVLALVWRAVTLGSPFKSLQVLVEGGVWAAALGALQVLPTLELARLGSRAVSQASVEGWGGANGIVAHGLQPGELLATAVPDWPMVHGSFNEHFPYVGSVTLLLALCGAALTVRRWRTPQAFALGLCVLGLGTALGWAPARWVFFGVPGAAQFAGLGRALVLWSLGAALLGAFGVEALGRRFPARAGLIALLACSLAALELGLNGWAGRETASREEIYPRTALTDWLRQNLKRGERVAFVTPRGDWQPTEAFRDGRQHPRGVLPPNGAMVYELDDVGGYDSLSPGAYPAFLIEGEPPNAEGKRSIAPQWNGNMALPSAFNSRLDALNVRYVISLSEAPGPPNSSRAFESGGCAVWKRLASGEAGKSGRDFSPGFRDGQYQPQSFRLGVFLSLCALGAVAAALAPRARGRGSST